MAKPSRSRSERRAKARAASKLAKNLDRLAKLGPGGSPERALSIETPAQVDVEVAAMRCPVCEGALRVDEHAAETIGGHRLRVARVVCAFCGAKRAIYFRLAETLLS